MGRGECIGSVGRLRTASGPHQPPRGHQPPADFRQASVTLCICFPPAEHKQKQLGPALLRPTSRLAICTHAQRAVPSYNSGNVFHTRDRGANDNPRRWHIHRLPGWAPLTPPLPPPPPAPLLRRLLLLSLPDPLGGRKQPLFRGACFLLSSKQSSPAPLSHQFGRGTCFPPSLPVLLPLESPISQRVSSDNIQPRCPKSLVAKRDIQCTARNLLDLSPVH